MSTKIQTLINHFMPLHELLYDLSVSANAAYPEGGMIWSFDYGHRKAHSAKIDGVYIKEPSSTGVSDNLLNHKFSWAKLIWRASGNSNDLVDNAECAREENRLICERYNQAEQVIKLFKSANADCVRMSFIDDDISIAADCVALFGHDAVSYNIFWSMN